MVTPLRSRSERTPPQSPVKVEGAEVGAGSERWPSAQARAPQPAAKHRAAAANVHTQGRPAVSPISSVPGVNLGASFRCDSGKMLWRDDRHVAPRTQGGFKCWMA